MSRDKNTFKGPFRHGAVEVGTDVVNLPVGHVGQSHGVLIKSASSNTGIVYVGNKAATADTAETSAGFPLDPGESFFVAMEEISEVHLIANTGGQFVHWIAR